MAGNERVWLDDEKFCNIVSDPTNWPEFENLMHALENYDIGINECLSEAGITIDYLDSEDEKALFLEYTDLNKNYRGFQGLLDAAKALAV